MTEGGSQVSRATDQTAAGEEEECLEEEEGAAAEQDAAANVLNVKLYLMNVISNITEMTLFIVPHP